MNPPPKAAAAKRCIAVFTGNRAEYGLLYPILKAIAGHPLLSYHLIVSGSHLKDDFGKTISEIERDGFTTYTRVQVDFVEDSPAAVAGAIGSGVTGISGVLASLRPDALLVYGDRYESFSATIAGTQMGIPTAHVEGGDYTEIGRAHV